MRVCVVPLLLIYQQNEMCRQQNIISRKTLYLMSAVCSAIHYLYASYTDTYKFYTNTTSCLRSYKLQNYLIKLFCWVNYFIFNNTKTSSSSSPWRGNYTYLCTYTGFVLEHGSSKMCHTPHKRFIGKAFFF